MQAIKVYNMRGVDELVFLDITATLEGRPPDFELVDDFADECFMPLTVGGGVRTVDDVRRLLAVGADKVAINTAAVRDPDLVHAVADRFGSQCVVVSIDVRRGAGGAPEVYTHAGREAAGVDPVTLARQVEARGAGEILLTAIDRDGTMSGYDLELVHAVSAAVSIPVIASGGAGGYADLVAAVVEGHAAAVAAASIFHFTEATPREAKLHMREAGLAVRLEPPA
jgi:imidazole glycerol-phosphate synthase subunit HisF